MVEASGSGEEVVGSELPLRYLPPGFLTVRDLCGDEVLWGLYRFFAGMRVMVPRKMPGEDHELVVALGVEGCRVLIKAFAGEVVVVPKCDSARRRLRDEAIRELIFRGESVNRVAHEMGLTYRQVQTICKGGPGKGLPVERNLDLFD